MTNTFAANHSAAINEVYNNLTEGEKEAILKYFIGQESLKKEQEINKNYKDIGRFNPERFVMFLEDRMKRKIWTSNKVMNLLGSEEVTNVVQISAEVESEQEEVKAAAKSSRKKATTEA